MLKRRALGPAFFMVVKTKAVEIRTVANLRNWLTFKRFVANTDNNLARSCFANELALYGYVLAE